MLNMRWAALVAFVLLASAWPCRATFAQEPPPDLPVSLISYDGEKPAPLAANDPLYDSIGVLYLAPELYAQRYPSSAGYATAFLISECYALTGRNVLSMLPITMKTTGGRNAELIGLRFGIGLKPGNAPDTLTDASFRASWPVSTRAVVPPAVENEQFDIAGWQLLHLDGCETGAAANGKPLAFDPVTSLELQAFGLPRKARHVGALMTDQLSLVELPCALLGQMRSLIWESTCSSWLGMVGGPVLTADEDGAWSAIGFIPQPNLGLMLNTSEIGTADLQGHDVYAVDADSPRYFDYTTHVVPMAQAWPWVVDLVDGDNPHLVDPRRAGVMEQGTDLRQSLLMQMQRRPESEWSAFDYTRFGIALGAIGYEKDSARFLKSAVAKDPSYLSAAFQLSRRLEWLGPQGISEAELVTVRNALGTAAERYPEDPQLILYRAYVDEKLARFQDSIDDRDRYQAATPDFPSSTEDHLERGYAFLALGDLARAQAAYADAYALDATSAEAILGMARIKLYHDDVAGALRLAEKAVRVDPSDWDPHFILAFTRTRNGDVDGGIAALNEACDICGRLPITYVYLAILRGYKRALNGDWFTTALLSREEAAFSGEEWPRPMVAVFSGERSLESLDSFDASTYTPEWRRIIDGGRLVFGAAYQLSEGETIDYPAVERAMMKYRDLNFAHLAPILKDWNDRLAARK